MSSNLRLESQSDVRLQLLLTEEIKVKRTLRYLQSIGKQSPQLEARLQEIAAQTAGEKTFNSPLDKKQNAGIFINFNYIYILINLIKYNLSRRARGFSTETLREKQVSNQFSTDNYQPVESYEQSFEQPQELSLDCSSWFRLATQQWGFETQALYRYINRLSAPEVKRSVDFIKQLPSDKFKSPAHRGAYLNTVLKNGGYKLQPQPVAVPLR